MPDIPIVVGKHAMDRMRERFPNLKAPEQVVLREVYAGIRDGRRSKTRPRWASTYTRTKDRQIRYVWNEQKNRCYVVTQKLIAGQGRGWFVVTALSPGDPSLADRKKWSQGEPNQTKTGKHSAKSSRVWKRGFQR